MVKCAIYARVSSDKQADSIEHQVSLLTEYAKERRWEVTGVYEDEAVSATRITLWQRPAMKRLLGDADQGKIQVVLFKGISRLARDVEEAVGTANRLKAKGLRILSLEENFDSNNVDSEFFFTIYAALARQEVEKLSIRVRYGQRQAAKSGKWVTGKPPYGYKNVGGRLIVDEDSAWIIRRIFDLYLNDGFGARKICDYLNDNNIPTAMGKGRWRIARVCQILQNPAYKGAVVHSRTRKEVIRDYDSDSIKRTKITHNARDEWGITENAHEAIIPVEIFDRVQQRLKKHRKRRKPNKRYPLSGIATCSKCGGSMVVVKKKNRKPSGKTFTYWYYRCSTYLNDGKAGCTGQTIRRENLEEIVFNDLENELKKWRNDREFWENFSLVDHTEKEIRREIENVKRRIKKLNKDVKDLFDQRDLFDEEIYKGVMQDKRKEIENARQQRDELKERLENGERESINIEEIREKIEDYFSGKLNPTDAANTFIQQVIVNKEAGTIKIEYILDDRR